MSDNTLLPLSVLLVEDNEMIGELTLRFLGRLFAQTHWAKTGTEGLALYHAHRPAMLVVDQLLPGCFGSELITEVRKSDLFVPILGISASSMGTEIEALEAAGATVAVEKPLTLGLLRAFVAEQLPQ